MESEELYVYSFIEMFIILIKFYETKLKIGCLLTGIFAQNSIVTMSGDSSINGGWLDGNYMQIIYQLLSIVVVALWSFIFTFIILQVIDLLPFVRLKLTEKEEEMYFFFLLFKLNDNLYFKFSF
jgi:hypothetical protein